MLRFSYLLLVLALCSLTHVQSKPEKVYSITKTVKPFEWYANQSQEWKQVIDKDPLNQEAWFNFYSANRMARMVNSAEYKKAFG